MKWATPQQLEDLLCELVSWDSRTGTEGEIEFAHKLKDKLLELDYFQQRDQQVQLHDAGKGLNVLTALYKHEKAIQTIVLMSHFDTVHTGEFASLGDLAFRPRELTEKFKQMIDELPEHVHADITSDHYLFGRGTMDMKLGLAVHMHLLEAAIAEQWQINLLLVTVPDEEVDSVGMRTAVETLVSLRKQHDLHYALFLNSEPSFSQSLQDENYYIYSGSIGKMMPSALFYGKQTHAGEPLKGINAHFMASYFTKEMEYNTSFMEEQYGEKTPLPICLKTYDLKQDYSTQTSHHVAALYNVFVMKRNAEEVMRIFKEIATEAMVACQTHYEKMCEQAETEPIGKIRTIEYHELLEFALKKLGEEKVVEIKQQVIDDANLDDREKAIYICDQLMAHCQELAPAVVVFFASPYYPAVNSSDHPLIKEKIKEVQHIYQEKFNIEPKQVHYFNGISDLSYVNYSKVDRGWKSFVDNLPVWEHPYHIPFEAMQQLQVPVLNVGPYGKDAHKLTERLDKESGFVQLPFVLKQIILSMVEGE